jgi:hypothetical protein
MAAHDQEHRDLVVSMFEGLDRFVRSRSALPFDAGECRAGMYQYLQSFESLHFLWRRVYPAAEHKHLPFRLRPKAHILTHLVDDKILIYGSPSSFWCYRDEDFVGVIKRIAAKTRHPATLEQRILEKLRIFAALS